MFHWKIVKNAEIQVRRFKLARKLISQFLQIHPCLSKTSGINFQLLQIFTKRSETAQNQNLQAVLDEKPIWIESFKQEFDFHARCSLQSNPQNWDPLRTFNMNLWKFWNSWEFVGNGQPKIIFRGIAVQVKSHVSFSEIIRISFRLHPAILNCSLVVLLVVSSDLSFYFSSSALHGHEI